MLEPLSMSDFDKEFNKGEKRFKRMWKLGIIYSAFGLIVGIALYYFSIVAIAQKIDNVKSNYEKPDTTITIHNGKPDTVIVKKQAPAWLK